MLKFRSNCKICIKCRDDKAFMKRLYGSSEYVQGGEPVLKIARETHVTARALYAHLKKHQAIDAGDLSNRQMAEIHRKEKNALVKQSLKATDVRQAVIDELATLLAQKAEEGGLVLGQDISVKDALFLVLKATKDSDEVAAKKKDQETDVMRLMMGGRSQDPRLNPGEEGDVDIEYEEGEVING